MSDSFNRIRMLLIRMVKYRLIATDLDGTLLGKDKRPTPSVVGSLRRARDRGVHIAIASGRMTCTQRDLAREMGLDCSMISYNGSVVVQEDGTIVENDLDADAMMDIIEYCYDRGYYVQTYRDDVIFTDRDSPMLRSDMDSWSAEIRFGDLREMEPMSAPKVVIVVDPSMTPGIMHDIQAMHPSLSVTQSSPYVVEIMPPGIDKSYGLRMVCERLGIDREEVVAFGDNKNDISMIGWAGLGVAVANAADELKDVADIVASGEMSDGVQEVLDRLFP